MSQEAVRRRVFDGLCGALTAVANLQAKGSPAAAQAETEAGVVPAPGSTPPPATGSAKTGESVTETQSGVMIAIVPPAELAGSLTVPDGLSRWPANETVSHRTNLHNLGFRYEV